MIYSKEKVTMIAWSFQFQHFKDGVIKGEDIPVQEGYYNYKGDIVIAGNNLEVSLLFDNYDDKKLEPSSWNGKYKLVNKNQ